MARPGPPGANVGHPRPFLGPILEPCEDPLHVKPRPELGDPLGIREVAALIGCSPWTVRQTLVPRGIPFFRSGASGRMIFYRDQVIRWIEQQQGGITTK